MQKLFMIFATLFLVITCSAQSTVNDDYKGKVGPVPPQAVIERDLRKAQEKAITYRVQQTLDVPSYLWRHGCSPTSLGMIIGYYDGLGFDNLIPGNASTQTYDVNQTIASGGDYDNPYPPGFEEHYEDYARPEDYYPVLLDDDYITQGREPHTDNCLADLMDTSKSTLGNYYGWTRGGADIGQAFNAYVSMKNYSPSYELHWITNTLTWELLTNEIDNGRPMLFGVDSDGDGETDHSVAVVGYRDQPSQQYGCLDTWYHEIRWEDFQAGGPGIPWGVSQGLSFTLGLRSPEINVKDDNDIGIPSGTGLYDFGRVGLGWSKYVTFTIKNLGDANLVLTGTPPVEISGADANEFVVSEQPSSLILPGESTTFEITFEPSGEGLYSATAVIDNNDANENPYTFSLTGTGTVAVTIYVDANAQGQNDGTSWTDAYNYFQDTLAAVAANPSVGDIILVAEGVYKPDANTAYPDGTGERTSTFQLIKNVTIEGGYAGSGEPDPNFRDINLYPTILSGDLQGNDVEISNPADLLNDPCRAENSYHVVTGSGTDSFAVLDGFTISGGNANGSNPDYHGGGMYNRNDNYKSAGPTVMNCRFYQNCANSRGGGIRNFKSNTTLTNCTFEGNFAGSYGGGISHYANHSTLTNCTFVNNASGSRGGGLYSWENSRARLINCLFSRNSSTEGGGMYNIYTACQPTLINCTFSENSASSAGGGIRDASASSTVTNCILWGNSVGVAMDEPAQINSTTATVNYSCIQGLTGALGGIGNIDCDPCFADPCGGDYHLQSGAGRWDPNGESWVTDANTSFCIDAGNPGCPLWDEPNDANNVRANLGVYGGTATASKTPANWRSIGDLTNDWVMDLNDLGVFVDYWLDTGESIPSDLNRNKLVNFRDFAIFAGEWLR